MTISNYLLDPDIDLTTEESQWEHVELIYRAMAYDEFQFTDRGRFFAVRWLLENRKWPSHETWVWTSKRWHWFTNEEDYALEHAKLPVTEKDKILDQHELEPVNAELRHGHDRFGESILFFTSLWPRFYVECVLPTQEGEPANAEEFWGNLRWCLPNFPIDNLTIYHHGKRLDGSLIWTFTWKTRGPSHKGDMPSHDYKFTYGNAIGRAIEAWRGETT